jgi:cystathionine gamma-synthase
LSTISNKTTQLTAKIIELAGVPDLTCLLFFSREAAAACVAFATSPTRKEGTIPADQIWIRLFDIHVRLYGVFYSKASHDATAFWMNAGVGISSRVAAESLKHIDLLHEVIDDSPAPVYTLSAAHSVLQERIATLLERATTIPRSAKVVPDDVYFFQSGMASIYSVHTYLLQKYNAESVLFGFAFHSTPHIFEDFGPGMKHFGAGSEADLIDLEAFLGAKAGEGRKIQALWTEFPSNPNLGVANISELRRLADKHDIILIADDTIGSFCNIDLFGADGVDIAVSSLSKSFSGYADLLGGSAILNPSSSKYAELKTLFEVKYSNYFYNGDAEALEKNSNDYLSRSTTLNTNAAALVSFLCILAQDPQSSIAKIYYPSFGPSSIHYARRMRTPTPDFTPGYGCLFSIEFKTVQQTIAFYDNLDTHQGPHLGAHLTLAMPYVKGIYGRPSADGKSDLESVGKWGVRETQIRVSAGLEDARGLVEVFGRAVGIADAVGIGNAGDEAEGVDY